MYPHGDIFILYLRSSRPHFAGVVALFVLSLLCCVCVLEASGIVTLGKPVCQHFLHLSALPGKTLKTSSEKRSGDKFW